MRLSCLRFPLYLKNLEEFHRMSSVIRKEGYRFKVFSPPATIVDAGANIGHASVLFASRFPQARVLAIEPEAGNFKRLRENCVPYGNITCVHGALVGHGRKVRIANPNALSHSFRVADNDPSVGNAGEEIDGITVPDCMRLLGCERLDILKMDIEGSEEEVFREGAGDWLERVSLLCLEVHDLADRQASRRVFRALDALEGPYYLRPSGENLLIRRIDPSSEKLKFQM